MLPTGYRDLRDMFNTGSSLAHLGAALRDRLPLERAVETGTFRGDTAVALSRVFPQVVTIELAPALHAAASARFAREAPNVRALRGDSGATLRNLPTASTGTFFFLDGHWSTGPTAGRERECPLMDELAAIAPGHPNDCIVIDDARLLAAAPPPPHDPAQWPTLMDVFDALRSSYPEHHVTLVADQVIAVPRRAKPVIDDYARGVDSWFGTARQLIRRAVVSVHMRLRA